MENFNKFGDFGEMDRTSESDSSSEAYFSNLNQLKGYQQHMLFGNNIYKTKSLRKQGTSNQLREYESATTDYDGYKSTTERYEKDSKQLNSKKEFLKKTKIKIIIHKDSAN